MVHYRIINISFWIFLLGNSLFAQLKEVPNENNPSRLGIKGYYGFVITDIDSSVKQPEVSAGDIIISTEISGQVNEVERFQSDIRSTKSASSVRSIAVKFNGKTKNLEKREVRLITFVAENTTYSKLGVKGVMGFVITEIDPIIKQTNVNIGDIITDTNLDGQISNILEFQRKVQSIGSDKEIRAIRLRFTLESFSKEEIELKTYPYPNNKQYRKSNIP